MQSTKFTITFGVNEGFSFNNTEANKLDIGEQIKDMQEIVEKNTGIYVSGILSKGQALYKNEWKCPFGGEVAFTFSGDRYNSYCNDDEGYRKAVKELTLMIKEKFKQEEIYLTFISSDLEIL